MKKQSGQLKLKQFVGGLHWVHWCVILASALLTFSAWLTSKRALEEKTAFQFDREATQIIELIPERMQKYEDALWAGVSMIQSHNGEINYSQWQSFSQYLEIEEKYPGINGIGVIYHVPLENKAIFLNQERFTRPDFRIYPQHNNNELWPITYIEPEASNKQAVGLDMAHETNRYTAAKKARDTGSAQITGPITLVQDSAKTPGFLFYAPFYKNNQTETLLEKQQQFVGLVYAPFIMDKLMKGTLRKEKRNVDVQISDSNNVLYDEHLPDVDGYDPSPLYSREITLDFYGRPWQIDLRSSLGFRATVNNTQPTIILISGLIIESLLIGLFVAMARANKTIASQLKASETDRQNYIDASGDGYWDWRIQEDYEYMSPRFWEMFGYLPEEKPHKPSAWQDMIFEEDLAVALENFEKHVTTKGQHPYEQEVRYRHKNGSTVTVLCRGNVIEWDKNNQPIRMVGTHTDITELKEKSFALERALGFQKLLTSVNTDLIFVKDKQFRIVQANPAFLSLYPKEQQANVIGHTTIEQYSEEEAEEFLAEDKKAFKEGLSEVTETITFPNGKARTLLTKKLRFEDINEQTFILGIARDITNLKETETALIKANNELEEFAYRTSHDLRSPLISSNKLLSIIQKSLDKGEIEQSKEYIQLVKESLVKLEQLVSDILTLTKLTKSEQPKTQINFKRIVDDTLSKLSHMEDYHRMEFLTNFQHKHNIYLANEHITLVIENLISNAIKYQNKNETKPYLSVSTQEKTSQLLIKVTDNGIGIPENAQAKLFTMFKRFHPNKSYGSGLGLYMVKKSVEKMDGEISYRNTGNGSEFLISLPIKHGES